MSDPEPGAHSRPEPVLDAAGRAGNIVGVIGGLSTALVSYAAIFPAQHWATDAAAFLAAVAAGLAKYLPAGFAVGARAQVTPLESPRGMDGLPLTTRLREAP